MSATPSDKVRTSTSSLYRKDNADLSFHTYVCPLHTSKFLICTGVLCFPLVDEG